MDSRIEEVILFWFGSSLDRPDLVSERIRVWFRADEAFDEKLRGLFQSDLDAAKQGELDAWKITPRGTLALIIILDQFSRNIFRGTKQAFHYDHIAQKHCLDGIKEGRDLNLSILERAFFYMPMQHAEDPDIQECGVKKFLELYNESPEELKKIIHGFYDSSIEHCDIIKKFGRFPHRNRVLGRKSTEEEKEFLKSRDSWYGQ